MNTPIHPTTSLLSAAILAIALASACGTNLTPTIAEISGRSVELVEAGSGGATVVFEAGLGDDWSGWDAVATDVATSARAFAYSRPGYGRSAPSPDPRDATHIVEDLRALLTARGFAPPYVLVGHSFGGTYMELYAKKYPQEVRGLVLVEPRHRDFTTACESAGLLGCAIPADAVASMPAIDIAEYEAFAKMSEEIAASGEFGSYPVRVLTGTSHGFPEAVEQLWVSMLGALAEEANDGEQLVFPGASHYLQLDHAREVADSIREVIARSEEN
jgi:pimeloyl-ACP methyl ester carboxylesterase